MTKQEFLSRLREGLSGLPEDDIAERLTFYGEMIDDRIEDGLSEEEAVAEVGSVDDIAAQIKENAGDRKTVAFLPLIATSQMFRDLCLKHGLQAREVNGESDDRAETLEWFHNAGPGSVLCNSMLLTEGWDEPSADCICILRPTKIRSLYVQMVGRGTRLSPGKKDVLLLDFLWMSERHDLVRPCHLVAKNPDLAERISEIMQEETQEEGGRDLLEAEDAAESTAREEREEKLRKELEEQRKRKRQLCDPLQFEDLVSDVGGSVLLSGTGSDEVDGAQLGDSASCVDRQVEAFTPDESQLWQLAPVSDAQRKSLEKAGIFPDEITCAGHASRILDTIAKRRLADLTTPRQIRCLERYGFRNVSEWTFPQAKALIDRIAANSWRVPRSIDIGSYKP